VLGWFDAAAQEELYISVLVLGEVRRGIEQLRRRDPMQATRFERWLNGLERTFEGRLLSVGTGVADLWGHWNARRTLPVVDGLMAATAGVHRLTFVTRDIAPLAHLDVRLLDPWQAQPS
jgi:toxin FitB